VRAPSKGWERGRDAQAPRTGRVGRAGETPALPGGGQEGGSLVVTMPWQSAERESRIIWRDTPFLPKFNHKSEQRNGR